MGESNLHLWLRYTQSTDELVYATDMKDEAIPEVLEAFLQDQIGAGADPAPAVESDVYTIRIRLDLSDDSFFSSHDCGNLGLRDGILMMALGRFLENKATQVPAAELAPRRIVVPSAEMKELAAKAVVESAKPVDVDEWAEKLAKDVEDADD
jgi:hypothetical protein